MRAWPRWANYVPGALGRSIRERYFRRFGRAITRNLLKGIEDAGVQLPPRRDVPPAV